MRTHVFHLCDGKKLIGRVKQQYTFPSYLSGANLFKIENILLFKMEVCICTAGVCFVGLHAARDCYYNVQQLKLTALHFSQSTSEATVRIHGSNDYYIFSPCVCVLLFCLYSQLAFIITSLPVPLHCLVLNDICSTRNATFCWKPKICFS